MSIIKGTNQIVAGFGGTKRPLGEVYFSQSSLATDNPGALPGWTGEYYENGKTLFLDLYNFVKADSTRHVTKAQYDNAIATYGECPKYVVDENTAQTSLRLPKYQTTGRHLVKKEVNGNDWYALYSDGWLEQGGISTGQTVTFLKTFANTNYTLTLGHEFGNASDANIWLQFAKGGKTTTGFTYANATTPANTSINWEAKGYAVGTPIENIQYPWISAYTSAIPTSVAQAAEFQQALTNTSVNKMDKVQFWTPDNFVQLRNYSMELDWANTYTGSASSTEPFGANLDDTNKELVMPADGLLFGTNYGGIVSVNGKQIFASTTDPNLTNSCFPLEVRKGDVVFMRTNVMTALVPFKYQSGANNLVLGLNYYGKYATLEALDTTSASILNNGQGQGRWALVGDDTNGYTRYYTKPTNNTFSAFEWAAGGADTYLGQETDYVVESQVLSDGSWYRKYKSGWVEQGGQTPTVAGGATTTVTLLKPYNNTVYNVVVQPVGAYTGSGEANNVIPTRTTTNFIIACGQIAAQAFSWRAEGQGA